MAFLPLILFILEVVEAIVTVVEAAEVVEGTTAVVEAATAVEGAAGGTSAAEGTAGGAAAAEGGGVAAAAGARSLGTAQLSLLRTAAQVSQWVARQIVEFEAFDLGMQAVEKAIAKLREATKSPEAKEMDDIVQRFNKAIAVLDTAFKDWPNWMAANFDKGPSFGTIQAPYVSLLRFDIFRNRLGTVADIRQKQVASAGLTASKTPTLPDFQALLRAAQSYATEMDKSSEELMQPSTPLTAGGLNSHSSDTRDAKATLAQAWLRRGLGW